jgi:hypothetical protein
MRRIAHWAATYEELAVRYDRCACAPASPGSTSPSCSTPSPTARAMGAVASLSSGDSVVVGAIRAMMPALFANAENTL